MGSESVLLVWNFGEVALDFSWVWVAFETEGFLSLVHVQGWNVQKVFISDQWDDWCYAEQDKPLNTPFLGQDSLVDWWDDW